MQKLASSLSAITSLANRLWAHNRVEQKQLNVVSGRCTPRPSQSTRIPQDIVDLIISYFIYDTPTLLACSTTCYSWHLAALPHLHHSLTTDDIGLPHQRHKKLKYAWPKPLQNSYELGLLPFVKRFRIRLVRFFYNTPAALNSHTLRYFSALTNLQEFGVDHLELANCMGTIQQCFAPFASTLRFLALRYPEGSYRQILYCTCSPPSHTLCPSTSLSSMVTVRLVSEHQQRFKKFREMYAARAFRLVLCVDVHESAAGYGVQKLRRMVKREKAKGGLDYLPHEPLIISEIRSPLTRLADVECGTLCGLTSSAL